ncbi:sentrin-specific protease 7 isoform X1 [Rousettus aegyptiacus]|uniref:sentrin-specific protease 7 isoform X1 n=2 Tax=Rousettus aegyptiacus TaxID=9407 RepID=UPI00168D4205|nr:sentrin-specific protease 7 isoform X1 [Rousettus aegyptiacus]XP_016000216.2 sentrin-specific protease 7 isoform X1 [Rousettus aegyptiacus]XP_016000217.2 sentrin-specific protease 7 isoform X1 [Rousettus aegyptiacus]
MDRGKAGRRRSSSEIVMEGKRKKSSSELHKITKMLNAKPDDVYVKSSLSKLRSSEQWDLPLQRWERNLRNKGFSLDHKSKKGVRGCPVTSKTSPERQLRVMLTNVLWTDLGRNFRKTVPRNDANLCDANKVQSDSLPSTSVDSLETCQKLEPLHQSLNLSKRIPRVILTNVLGTELGRKYIKTSPVTEASLGDTDNLQSEQLSSSSDGSLESCQTLNPHKSSLLSKRVSQLSKRVYNKYAKQAARTKEKRRDGDSISLIMSDTQPKDLNSGTRHDHLEEGSRNKDDTYSDSKVEPTLISGKRKKKLRSNLSDSHNSTSLFQSAEQTKEQENNSTVSTESEKSSENHYQDPKLIDEITPEPIESDFTKLSSLNSQELILSAAPKSTSDCSIAETFESSVSTDTLENSTLIEKDENELNTKEKPVLSEHSEGNQSLISAEPIVVSSDEEGPIEHKSSEILKLQSKQDHAITNENESTSKSPLSGLPLITCDSASSELRPYNPVMENISCIIPSNEKALQLDFIFTSVYIGKIKGASKGCVTFTPKYVKIPFQVSLNEVSLLVDTKHLKRFGLWKSKDDDHSKRSHAILFLWVSSHYLEEIQTQLENSVLSQQSKSSEFIFLELHNPITQREELKLKDIMTEISTTNGQLELSYPLSWVQAAPLFQNLSSKEYPFIHHYCASFPAVAAEEMKMKSTSQPSNIDTAKPNYTFLQKQTSGCYSLSITTNPDEEWREVRHTGPVQKLIVYPPPPTKGGLGVTNEDLECLEEGEFLNDVIIDFYLKYLILEKASDELVERSHIFSSFFYKCLTRKENNLTEDNPNLSMAQRRHKRVRTWTRHINIFNKDYIFVPVNESSHWYLAVICFPWLEEAVYEDFPQTISQQSQHNKTIDNDLHTTSTLSLGTEDSQSTEMNMSVPKKMCKRPCILVLDSLKAASIQNTVQNLREYLEVEWEVKRKTHREFSKTNMVDLCPKVPKQDNSSDCGVYLLQYVESFLKDPIVNFELPIHLEKWFPRHVIKTKREDIRELILKLHLQQQKGNSS